jgi:mannose-6-phosphate isomerase-like protein (cupin superfamily)
VGRLITLSDLPVEHVATGVSRSAVTQGDLRDMTAALVRIAPGARWTATAPTGSDCYLFLRSGSGVISAGAAPRAMPEQSFAAIEEGLTFTVGNDGTTPIEAIHVLAPPADAQRGLAGFKGGIHIAERDRIPVVAVPEQKKRKLYIVGPHAVKSERAHAMIVLYEQATVTGLHQHPNAESLFLLLDGTLEFTINGAAVAVGPGQAAYFKTQDRHGLRPAEGCAAASFLEFHVPAAYTTVRE